MKLRRWFKRILIAAAVIIVVLISLNLILTAIWSRQIDRKLAELRARGEPVTLADLVPEPVPDEENAALLYDKALALLSDEDQRDLADYFSDYLRDDERAEAESNVRVLVEKQTEMIPLIDDAFTKPHCIYVPKQQDGIHEAMNTSWRYTSISRFLAACAIVKAKNGDTDSAVDVMLRGLRLAQPQDEQLNAPRGNPSVAVDTLQDVIPSLRLTQAQAQLLYDSLANFDLTTDAINRIRIERVDCCRVFSDARRNLATVFHGDGCGGQIVEPLEVRILGMVGRPLICKDQLYYLARCEKEITNMHKPYRLIAKHRRSDPWYAYLSDLMTYEYMFRKSRDSQQAQIGLAQTTLALKTYKNRYGSYPASLKGLKTYPGWKLPEDPFSGKPFGYKRVGQGFRVWSIGDDLVDDGGRLDSEIQGPGTAFREDMVWIVER